MGTRWTAARRAKFARTLKAKKSGRSQVRARMTVRADGKTNPASDLRAIGGAMIDIGNLLEPLSPAEAKLVLEEVARKFNLAVS